MQMKGNHSIISLVTTYVFGDRKKLQLVLTFIWLLLLQVLCERNVKG